MLHYSLDIAAITTYIELNPQVRFCKPVVKLSEFLLARLPQLREFLGRRRSLACCCCG